MGTDLVFSDVSLLYFIFFGFGSRKALAAVRYKNIEWGENLLAADTNNENLR